MAKDDRTPATELVPVQSIIPERYEGDGAVCIMVDGSYRSILRVGSVNFDMTARYERAGIVQNFGALIDSLDVDMPLQIVSVPKQLDTRAYSLQFQQTINNPQAGETRRLLARAHVEFYDAQVHMQALLQRNIYVVIPYKGMTGQVSDSFSDQMPFMGIIGALAPQMKKKFVKHVPTQEEIMLARAELDDRTAMIESALLQIGIKVVHRLGADAITDLLYEAFHPGLAERQRRSRGDDNFSGGMLGELPSASPSEPGGPRRRRSGGAIPELPRGRGDEGGQ